MALVERAARSPANILITGESGTGKELIARAIHQLSLRAHRSWVDLSCAALPEHLMESELFGHEKGAFSGADTSKPGLFELANGGTIFLDEIAELDARMQAKLLRVLDGIPYFRLGGVRKVAVDARVVAATNRDLHAAVAEGKFRVDLHHRLQQFVLRIPPLRERVEDIAPLARHFLSGLNPRQDFSAGAIAALESRAWPGNIRELRNAVIQASLVAKGDWIELEDVALRESWPCITPSPNRLDSTAWSAARSCPRSPPRRTSGASRRPVRISRRTLSRRLKSWGDGGIGTES